jgi:hypothetical protein
MDAANAWLAARSQRIAPSASTSRAPSVPGASDRSDDTENVAGNHAAPLASPGRAAALGWRRIGHAARVLVVGLALSLVLFAATVRWQPFNARLETPLFVVLAPCLAALLVRFGRVAIGVVVAVLVVASLPALVASATRPIVAVDGLVLPGVASVFRAPRIEQYFASRRDVQEAYLHLGGALRAAGCSRLALASGYDGFEYPLWLVAAPLEPEPVFVVNSSAEIRDVSLPAGACLVVLDERPPTGTPPLSCSGQDCRALAWGTP